MILKQLKLTNFKNHTSTELEFKERVNVFIGKNGVGKTNILDSIHYLSVFKSFINLQETQLIHKDSDFFRIEGRFSNDYMVVAKYASRKKIFEINESKLKKYSEYFGHIPLIIACPADIFIFYGGSEERRKLMDYTISVFDKSYLYALNEYNAYLEQRNAHLKSDEPLDLTLIQHYDKMLVQCGESIYNKRRTYLSDLLKYIDSWYMQLSNKKEWITMKYTTQLENCEFSSLLEQSLEKDRILGRTTKGIHRDDLIIEMNGIDIKKIASQGQQKSLLYAIRLAQAELIHSKIDKKLLFLLDDFSDKLDATRMRNLLEIISKADFISQWFITDTKMENFEGLEKKMIFNI